MSNSDKQPQSLTGIYACAGSGAGRQGRKLTMLLVALLAIFLFSRPAEARYGGGSGTAQDPYLIYTAEQMNAIGAHPSDWDKHFALMNDVDFGGLDANKILPTGDQINPFEGVFDGDDETDFVDFCLFAARWLQTSSSFWCGSGGIDLTDDGRVNFDDLKQFAENWLAEDIWRLTEADYITVDDFESYGEANEPGPPPPPGSRIWYTWRDGLGWTKPYEQPGNGTSSMVDLELTLVHGGAQALSYQYKNNRRPYYSLAEVKVSELTSGIGPDWTEEGIAVLSLWFRGDASNDAAPMSVVLNGSSAVYHDNPDAARIDTWTEWTIELQAFTGVDLANVNSIAIRFGDTNSLLPGGSGMVIFDDIRLYGPG